MAIEGYILQSDLRMDKTNSGIGGGILVYSKPGIEVCKTDRLKENTFTQFVEFSVGGKTNIIVVYRSPNSDQPNTEKLCNILKKAHQNSIIIGDVNLPGIDWEEETAYPRGRGVLEAAQEAGLEQLVTIPTHTKGNILDLLLTNNPAAIIAIYDGGRIGKSDHCSLVIEKNM